MSKSIRLLLIALVCIALGILGTAVIWQAVQPEQGEKQGRTSSESAALNDAYLRYVRMNNPELDNESNQRLLNVGYATCDARKDYSQTVVVYNLESLFTNAGQRIYDGATQYLC